MESRQMTTAVSAKTESAIESRLQELWKLTEVLAAGIGNVRGRVSQLEERIQPVIAPRPTPVQTGSGRDGSIGGRGAEEARPSGPCPLAARLDDVMTELKRVVACHDEVESLICDVAGRVQL